jgi:hypothetical protein
MSGMTRMNKNAVIKHVRDNKKRARKARNAFEKALHLLIADAWMTRAHATATPSPQRKRDAIGGPR